MTDMPTAAEDAAATTSAPGEPPVRPRRRRSLALRFGVSFALGLVLAVGVGAGALYAWGAQYEGLVLPGVRIGTTDLGGLTSEQAAAAIETAYDGLGAGEIALTGPDGQLTTISYDYVDRGPDTSTIARRCTRGRPPGRGRRQAARRTRDSDPRHHPRSRRDLRHRQAGGRRRASCRDDRPDPHERHRLGRQGRDVHGLTRGGRSCRRPRGAGGGARAAARAARRASIDRDGRADGCTATGCRDRLGRGRAGCRGSDGGRHRRRRGQGPLEGRPLEARAADLVLDCGRWDDRPGARRGGTRPDRQDAGAAGRPRSS